MTPSKRPDGPSLFDTDQADEVAELREQVAELESQNEAMGKELWRYRDQISRRDRDLKAWEERVVSARRRAWEEGCQASASLFVAQQARKARQPLDALIRVVGMLGDKPKAQQLSEAVLWARQAKEMLGFIEGDDAAGKFHAEQRAEVDRLREYLTVAGRKRHGELGHEVKGPTFTGCECPGCVLIIGMDVLGDHEPAPEAA